MSKKARGWSTLPCLRLALDLLALAKAVVGLLRILLALCVAVGHLHLSRPLMLGGGEAVKIFFMISGFYMALILSRKYRTQTWGGLRRFWISRYLRLYPVYVVTLALSLAWYVIQLFATNGRTPLPALFQVTSLMTFAKTFWLWVINITGFASDIPSLLGIHVSSRSFFLLGHDYSSALNGANPDVIWLGKAVWVAQFWSVGSELWFYLVAPLVFSLPLVGLIGLMVGAWWAGYAWVAVTGNDTYFFTPYLLFFFLAGVVSYRCLPVFRSFADGLPVLPKILLYGAPVIWIICLPSTGVALPSALNILVAFVSIPALFAISAKNSFDRGIGDLSYPLYVSHLLAFAVVANVSNRLGYAPGAFVYVISVLLAFLVAFLLERLVQAPVEQFRQRFANVEP